MGTSSALREHGMSMDTSESSPMVFGQEPSEISALKPLVRLETMENLISQFRSVAGKSGYLCEREFKRAADIRSDFFAARLFHAIDQDRNGCITCDEFVKFMYDLKCRGPIGQIKLLFEVYDVDGSGGLTHDELVHLLKASVKESNSQMEQELINHVAGCIISSFDADGDGEISCEEFVAGVSKYPHLLSGLTVIGLGTDNAKNKASGVIARINSTVMHGFRTVINNPQRAFWLAILVTVLVLAFWWRASRYTSGPKCELMSWTLPVAKGCGQMIKVTTTLILLPVSRRTMTFLRETPLRHIIPFDDAIPFHILLGTLGFIFAWIHSLCHINDFLRWGDPQRNIVFKKAFPEEDEQPSYYELWTSLVGVTGVLQLICYTLVFVTASNWPRRASWLVNTRLGRRLNNFRLIWYVHHLTAIFIGLLLVHAVPHIPNEKDEWAYSDVWAWIGIPVLVYVMERICKASGQTKHVRILSAELLPGKVIALKMSRPKGFSYECGMCVYINCPSISKFEWHPFSLTSAPGARHLSVHIRVVGDWTEELYNRFRAYGNTLRHEEFSVSQKGLLQKLQTFTEGFQSRSLEFMSLQQTSGKPPGKAGTKGTMLFGSRQGGVDMDRQAVDHDNLAETPSDMFYSVEEAFPLAKLSPPARLETPSSTLSISRDATKTDVRIDCRRSMSPATRKEENLLTRMSPASDLPRVSPQVTTSQSDIVTGTPFAAYAVSGASGRATPCELQPARSTPLQDRSPSTPLRISHMNSFLLDLAHLKDIDVSGDNKDESNDRNANRPPVKLLLDGPFGAPVQGYRDYPVLLLVGAGIGVTPFASVLSDLVHRMGSLSPRENEGGVQGMPHLKKVYFHWSVHSQSEVVWFSRVLEAIAKEDKHGYLDVNIHITGLRTANDIRTLPLKLVQVAIHHDTGVDVMCGLNSHVLTRFGRPDWPQIFRDLQLKHRREKIGVFYSGPNTLASVLRKLSHRYSVRGSKFIFTKESFGYW